MGGLSGLSRVYRLEVGELGRAGEGDDVPDIGHAGDVEHEALEAEAEARVGRGAEAAEVEVPGISSSSLRPFFAHEIEEDIVGVSSRSEPPMISPKRGTRRSMALTVLPSSFTLHVEGLDLLGVVREEEGPALLSSRRGISRARSGGRGPNRALPRILPGILLEDLRDGLRVGHVGEGLFPRMALRLAMQALLDALVEEGRSSGAVPRAVLTRGA